nr:MAG TPA: hypothetical protein [Caudoviricetes sp.]
MNKEELLRGKSAQTSSKPKQKVKNIVDKVSDENLNEGLQEVKSEANQEVKQENSETESEAKFEINQESKLEEKVDSDVDESVIEDEINKEEGSEKEISKSEDLPQGYGDEYDEDLMDCGTTYDMSKNPSEEINKATSPVDIQALLTSRRVNKGTRVRQTVNDVIRARKYGAMTPSQVLEQRKKK